MKNKNLSLCFLLSFTLTCTIPAFTDAHAEIDSESDHTPVFETLEPFTLDPTPENSSSNQFMDFIDPNTTPVKVVGRGLVDRKTDQVLQLACVGPILQGLERSCSKLRFLLTQRSGTKILIGPILEIAKTDEKIRSQIHEQLKERKLARDLFYSRNFKFMRLMWLDLFGNAKKFRKYSEHYAESDKAMSGVALLGLAITTPIVTNAINAGKIPLGVGLGAIGVLSVFSPVLIDVALLPFTLIADKRDSDLNFGFNVKTIDELQSRAAVNWPINPKPTRSQRFQTVIGKLAESDEKFPVQMIHESSLTTQQLAALGVNISINWNRTHSSLRYPDASTSNPNTAALAQKIADSPCYRESIQRALSALHSKRLLDAYEKGRRGVKAMNKNHLTYQITGLAVELWISSDQPENCSPTENYDWKKRPNFVSAVVYWKNSYTIDQTDRRGMGMTGSGTGGWTYSNISAINETKVRKITFQDMVQNPDSLAELAITEVERSAGEISAGREPENL